MNEVWWGEFEFADNETRVWNLGPLTAWITRAPSEFRVANRSDPGADHSELRVGEIAAEPDADDAETIRYGVRDATRRLEIKPATGDRAMVVKSASTFIVPEGGETTIYVSSPLWFQVELLGPRRFLHEEPTRRPSDTWFGSSTLHGELCYAIRTTVRYGLENVPRQPNRAISVVKILNRADTPLPLARLRLPLPYLSLYADEDGRLWTEAVTLDRGDDDDLAEVKLGKAAPPEAGPCKPVAGPRVEIPKNQLIRSFTGLLGLGKEMQEIERIVE